MYHLQVTTTNGTAGRVGAWMPYAYADITDRRRFGPSVHRRDFFKFNLVELRLLFDG